MAMPFALRKEDMETHNPGIWCSAISRDTTPVDSINLRSKVFGIFTSVLSRYILVAIL